MILLIDNYDSFSYNLYQLVGSIDPDIQVVRNDVIQIEEISAMQPAAIILSPGPGRPENAGVCCQVVAQLGTEIPILGVCLGHQSICQVYGAKITYAKELIHGKQSFVKVDLQCPLFQNCPEVLPVARYHSLAVAPETLPACLHTVAKTDDNTIMAVQHKNYPVFGVQFHPESIMTPDGRQMIANFLTYSKERVGGKEHD